MFWSAKGWRSILEYSLSKAAAAMGLGEKQVSFVPSCPLNHLSKLLAPH